jgi:hypothetical protein
VWNFIFGKEILGNLKPLDFVELPYEDFGAFGSFGAP